MLKRPSILFDPQRLGKYGGSISREICVLKTAVGVYPFTPKSDQRQISPAALPVILDTQYEELGFPQLTQMKHSCTTNSHYLTYALLLKVGRIYFLNLGVKGLDLTMFSPPSPSSCFPLVRWSVAGSGFERGVLGQGWVGLKTRLSLPDLSP